MRWRDVQPLPEINGDLSAVLANVDVLREPGKTVLSRESPEDFTESRQRSLGGDGRSILKLSSGLHDVDWAVTEVLGAEGLDGGGRRERTGGIDDDSPCSHPQSVRGLESSWRKRRGRERR